MRQTERHTHHAQLVYLHVVDAPAGVCAEEAWRRESQNSETKQETVYCAQSFDRYSKESCKRHVDRKKDQSGTRQKSNFVFVSSLLTHRTLYDLNDKVLPGKCLVTIYETDFVREGFFFGSHQPARSF